MAGGLRSFPLSSLNFAFLAFNIFGVHLHIVKTQLETGVNEPKLSDLVH